ncbi:MAG: cytochrome c [Rhodobacteraceae bacterium]|nr:cytochrome c [Alphaproteobacteria bacterium]MBT8475961.1 cytochrome c [Alphaproteobacteria bacterium]NNK66064.1 cytochrome c [Paracoccaceae bacterium]
MRRFLCLMAALLLAAPAYATDPDIDNGEQLFRSNCATCHGLSARGDGPMTAILQVLPPDLTLLRGADGVFPLADVVRQIDGRDMMLAHGGPMPIFGFILEDQSGVVDDVDGTPVFTSQAVVDIARWLESIQR